MTGHKAQNLLLLLYLQSAPTFLPGLPHLRYTGFLAIPGMPLYALLPQGLCTYCSLGLERSFLRYHLLPLLHSFRSGFKCPLFSEDFLIKPFKPTFHSPFPTVHTPAIPSPTAASFFSLASIIPDTLYLHYNNSLPWTKTKNLSGQLRSALRGKGLGLFHSLPYHQCLEQYSVHSEPPINIC